MKKIKEKEVAEMAEEKPETKGEKFTGTAEDMRAAMEKATNLKVVYITTADFDADGNNESFALATDDSKDPYWGYHTAEIWFADSNGECQCIKKEENISMNDEVLGGRNLSLIMKNMSIKHRLSVVIWSEKWTAVRVADIWKYMILELTKIAINI